MFVFTGAEELSYEKPYWGKGYRDALNLYPHAFETARRVVVVDSVGFGEAGLVREVSLVWEAFPVRDKEVLGRTSVLISIKGLSDNVYLSFYHTRIDTIEKLECIYMVDALKKLGRVFGREGGECVVRVKDLVEIIESSIVSKPCIDNKEERGKNGLVMGNPDDDVKGIVVAWKPTRDVLRRAAKLGYNVVIFHEDLLYDFKPHPIVKEEVWRNPAKARVNADIGCIILRNGLNMVRYHTTWDDADGGNNDVLVKDLGLRLLERLPCSRLAELSSPTSLEEFARRVASVLKPPHVIVAGNLNLDRVERVLVVAGGGAKHPAIVDEAAALGAQVLLSADVTADTMFYAYELGIAIVDPGHHAMEEYGMKEFYRRLKEELGRKGYNVPVEFIENKPVARVI